MDEGWTLQDELELAKEAGGVYRAFRGDEEPGQVPAPSRSQAVTAPEAAQLTGTGGNGGRNLLIPALAALVVGWIAWKASGKPMVGLIAALVAGLIAWFLFARQKAPVAAAAA